MKHVICLQNKGFLVSLKKRKIYPVIEDKTAEQKKLFRIKDETGQFYLYPKKIFIEVKLPQFVVKAINKAA